MKKDHTIAAYVGYIDIVSVTTMFLFLSWIRIERSLASIIILFLVKRSETLLCFAAFILSL